MASVVKDPYGRKRVLFVDQDGSRKTIRLGKCSQKQAETFKVKVESLIVGRFSTIEPETARWVTDLPDDMHARLAAVGLVSPRAAALKFTLGPFLDEYIASRQDVKPNTVLVYGRTRKHLVDFFGADKALQDITEGAADEWRMYLVSQGLATNTVNRTCGIARQFFRAAVRRRLIRENPFTELKTAVTGNKAREYFLSRQDAEKILEACPNTEWKLIFALARFGGLRTPSETLLLRWEDINWGENKMLVRSPKTEHHPGGESRLVPIFPELSALLTLALAEADPGPGYVIAKHRKTGLNLRTYLLKILAKAGVKPWPKLFQNLRSTRQTELAREWPEYLVCAWMGNSRVIAREHYLQVTDEHFQQAAQNAAHLAQKATQYPVARDSMSLSENRQEGPENADYPLIGATNGQTGRKEMGGTGLEPVTPSVSSWCSSQLS